MKEIISAIAGGFDWFDDLVWGPPLLILLLGVGIFLTLSLRGLQVSRLPLAARMVFTPHKESDGKKGDLTSFAALCTALAATIGTGNIVGVATAVSIGGPGALFWMFVAAFFGMATKYSECLLAVHFRETDSRGKYVGGPMFYITNMQPQTKPFNGSDKNTPAEYSPWFRIEERTRSWAGKFDTLYVCKGGVIGNSTKTIGSGTNKIPVPSYFFVALLGKIGSTYKAIGFWMEHLGSYSEKKALSNYAVNIDQLEQLAGFDFFCNLPDEIENAAEKSFKASDWDNLQ